MNTCDTCKWWTKPERSVPKFGHECTNEKITEAWDEKGQPEDSLMYSYAEGGAFYPGPKFGCIHWEPK